MPELSQSLLTSPRPRFVNWSLGTALLGLGWTGFLAPVGVGIMSLEAMLQSGYVKIAVFTVGFTLLAAAVSRRPAFGLSALAACTGVFAGLIFLGRDQAIAATPTGDEFLPRGYYEQYRKGLLLSLDAHEVDLSLLQRGVRAASTGHPLLAPEGGYLVPYELKEGGSYISRIRYGSAAMANTAPAWQEVLQKEQKLVEALRQSANTPLSDSPAAWARYGLKALLVSLVLVALAEFAARLSRALFGASR